MSQNAFLNQVAAAEARVVKTALFPARWNAFSAVHKLDWKSVDFNESGKASVDDKSGVYCFHVGHAYTELPIIGVALYGGETVNLRTRYGQYMQEKTKPDGRVGVKKFLNVFEGELVFRWAVVDEPKATLRVLERALNDALMPAYSIRDFSAEVKAGKDAWQ